MSTTTATRTATTTAMILAGGMGTRLRAAVADRPKVLAEVNGRPFITYLLDQLAAHDVRRVVLCTGYRAELVPQALGESYRSMQLTYSRESEPLGTGGAVRQALSHLADGDNGPILVLNGDSFCAADLFALRSHHEAAQAQATLLLTRVPDTSRFGQVVCDSSGRVRRFQEKQPGAGAINAGVYVLSRKFVQSIPEGRAVSLEREVFPAWIGKGLFGFDAGAAGFIDIGTPESYADAAAFLRAGEVMTRRRGYVFLDRDGTILVERHYLADPAGVEILPNASAGLRRLAEMNFGLIVLTNQSGIGRGLFDTNILVAIHARMEELLAADGVRLDAIHFCPHLPSDNCDCRKPRPGMLVRAAAEVGIDPRDAFVIGDKPCDIELGAATGATTLLVRTGYGDAYPFDAARPDHTVADLCEAADVIARLTCDADCETRS